MSLKWALGTAVLQIMYHTFTVNHRLLCELAFFHRGLEYFIVKHGFCEGSPVCFAIAQFRPLGKIRDSLNISLCLY